MAIVFNIPEVNWVRVQDSVNDFVPFGNFVSQAKSPLVNFFPLSKFATVKSSSLKYMKVGFYKNNCTGKFRIRIHTTPECNTNYAVSNWVDIEEIKFPRFIGNIRFDFDKCILDFGKRYYVTAEAIDYVRNGDLEYMSYVYDYPFKTNDSDDGAPFDCPIRMEIFHK